MPFASIVTVSMASSIRVIHREAFPQLAAQGQSCINQMDAATRFL
jgi:hypothetical protein